MNRILLHLFILFFCGFKGNLNSQELHVAPFEGTVYKLPNGKKYYKFKESYKDFPVINSIKWDKINVPSRDVNDGFPDVDRKGSFAIMFKTTFRATKTAMFEFNLTSDDGSILWIDGKEIINNDTQGAMHIKTDTIAITEGMHDIKIWYIQAYPTMHGIIFDYNHVDVPLEYEKVDFTFDSDILFDVDKYKLNSDGLTAIDKLITKLKNYSGIMIRIVGHTDNTGNPEYNMRLSEKRATSLKEYLAQNLKGKRFSFAISGRGDTMPIADNTTEEGRSKNRRVNLELVY